MRRVFWLYIFVASSLVNSLVGGVTPMAGDFNKYEAGYELIDGGKEVKFIYNERTYKVMLHPDDRVFVAGSFNNWAEAAYHPEWYLSDADHDRIWELVKPKEEVNRIGISGYPEFKFVVFPAGWQNVLGFNPKYIKNGNLWINWDLYGDATPPTVMKATILSHDLVEVSFLERLDVYSATKVSNYKIDQGVKVRQAKLDATQTKVELTTSHIDYESMNFAKKFTITIYNVEDRHNNVIAEPVKRTMKLKDSILDSYFNSIPISNKVLGATVTPNGTVFRLFGPRLSRVQLLLYEAAQDTIPFMVYEMQKDSCAIWEVFVDKSKATHGTYYKYRIFKGEETHIISDIYAKANVYSSGKSIVVDDEVNVYPFDGWTDQNYVTPPMNKLIIYETHIADISYANKYVGKYNGKYLGLTIDKEGTPLRHLKELGINAVELMPIAEVANGNSTNIDSSYHWGYMTSLYFSPESYYSSDPVTLKQVGEFKKLVNTLHNNGIAVILDVVYNHTSNRDNYFRLIDEEYYYTGTNRSGCGNDCNCKRSMMKKLILDNLKYWVSAYHIDGFRFDISNLINQKELFTKENIDAINQAKATKGDVILIAENWGNRAEIKATGVAQWNDQFRERCKRFLATGEGRTFVEKSIRWTQDKGWYAGPMESINYLESHDEETIAGLFASHGDSPEIQKKKSKLGAILLFTSQGVPMILEGQEMLRNRPKQTLDLNTNVIDWNLATKNKDLIDYYAGLIKLRLSHPALMPEKDMGDDYIKFLDHWNPKVLAYILNNNKRMEDYKFLIILNADFNEVEFTLPKGGWNQIVDHIRAGNKVLAKKKGKITIPPLSGMIFAQ
ncbi:MAG TPA: hypothetical protein EYP60_02680 [bacterium (Candidatus Stahlbacteria)]|nr:hypothetical protein [Candidatus Stahlbacteria bacterium]